MATTFQRCDESVNAMAAALMVQFPTHTDLIEARVKVDYVFAMGERDDQDQVIAPALKHNGCRALGIAKKISLKERALGRGDAEISLDKDWWDEASAAQQRALLDHELHHVAVKKNKEGTAFLSDDLGRPVIRLRKHDYQFGWFTIIAQRHGKASVECKFAATIWDEAGQYYWPGVLTQDSDEKLVERIDTALAADKSIDTVRNYKLRKIARNFKEQVGRSLREGESVTISTPGGPSVTLNPILSAGVQ